MLDKPLLLLWFDICLLKYMVIIHTLQKNEHMKYLGILFGLMVIVSCQQNKKTSTPTETRTTVYSPPQPPAVLTSPEDQNTYVFDHYWDNYNFQDTLLSLNPEYSEQAIVNYINMMKFVDEKKFNEGLEDLFNQAKIEPKTFQYLTTTMDRYLGDPNSPLRNDILYEGFIINLLKTDKLTEAQTIKYKTLLPMVQKNKPGSKAADFKFLKDDATISSLYEEKADWIFLFFYEPGCSSCADAIEALKDYQPFNALIDSGKLKVLAIYPDGNRDLWDDYKAEIPENWINGLDEEQYIVNKGIYQIKATPTIYLLDQHKNVLLKDANLDEVAQYLKI